MSKTAYNVIIALIITMMLISMGIVIKFGSSMMKTLAGNKVENDTIKPTNTYVSGGSNNQNISSQNQQNVVLNETNEINNVIINAVNEIVSQNNIVENVIENQTINNVSSQNINEVNPSRENISIRSVQTGYISALGENIGTAIFNSSEQYNKFLTQYQITTNSEEINEYKDSLYYTNKNVGVIYFPLEDGQSFTFTNVSYEDSKLVIQVEFNKQYEGSEKNNGNIVLLELNKDITEIKLIT